MCLQQPDPVRQMLVHEYHERLDTHGVVLDWRSDIKYRNTKINTIGRVCWHVPASASSCQT